jgi:hypothetical protein
LSITASGGERLPSGWRAAAIELAPASAGACVVAPGLFEGFPRLVALLAASIGMISSAKRPLLRNSA